MDTESLNIPNLDALSPQDLQSFAIVAAQLAEYALLKRQAITYRELGLIQNAQRFESQCEAIYKALPEEATW